MDSSRRMEISNRRWGYIIVICKFIVMFMGHGIAKSFGVLIPEMVARLNGSYASIGLICSLPNTVMMISTPFITLILARVNHRLFAMFGGIISAVCLGACGFVSNLILLGVCLTLTGIGRACVYHTITLLLNDYFPEKFVLVNTLALYGVTSGVLFLPVIVERCLQAYGYSWVFLILGAIMLHIEACAAAIRRPVFTRIVQTKEKDHEDESTNLVETEDISEEDETVEATVTELKAEQIKVSVTVHGEKINDKTERSSCNPVECAKTIPRNSSCLTEEDSPREDAVVQLGDEKESDTGRDPEERYPLIKNNGETCDLHATSDTTNRAKDKRGYSSSVKSILEHYCNPPLLKERVYLLYLPIVFFHIFSISSWILFLVPHSEQLGIPLSRAVFLSSIGGVGGLLGRTITVILLARNIDIIPVYIAAGAICSALFLIDAFGVGFASRASLAFVQGLCFFVQDSSPIALLKLTVVKKSNFSNAYGLMCFIYATGVISAGSITGALYDAIQSYTKIFNIIGFIEIFFVANIILVKVLLKKRNREET